MDLSIVIPTRDRRAVLLETLRRLESQAAADRCEAIVVDDGSADGTPAAATHFAERSSLPVRVLSQSPSGPAAARNLGLRHALGSVTLFLGDDTWPSATLVARHLAFHRLCADRNDAMLGRARWAPECRPTEFMKWLEKSGIQFGYPRTGSELLPGRFFYTSNVSAKTALLRDSGGFNEDFKNAACEDVELGLRLERIGMRLHFDAEALVDHFHPVDLVSVLRRMKVVGAASAQLAALDSAREAPRPPDTRHRAKAFVLTLLNLSPLRPSVLRAATWRFLCEEVHREAFWGVSSADERPRIGRRLCHIAERDPATRHPLTGSSIS
jgi:glycosyltransferase involved in cell wall biosynthesis